MGLGLLAVESGFRMMLAREVVLESLLTGALVFAWRALRQCKSLLSPCMAFSL